MTGFSFFFAKGSRRIYESTASGGEFTRFNVLIVEKYGIVVENKD
jgi:hypothetical protein